MVSMDFLLSSLFSIELNCDHSLNLLFSTGHWRFLEFNYHFRVLSLILGLVDENSWPLTEVVRNEVLETLSDVVPTVILSHLLDWYCTENSDSELKYLFYRKENLF